VIVPFGIALTIRLIPDGLMHEFHAEGARREVQDGFLRGIDFLFISHRSKST
jgi:hypothetical protein